MILIRAALAAAGADQLVLPEPSHSPWSGSLDLLNAQLDEASGEPPGPTAPRSDGPLDD